MKTTAENSQGVGGNILEKPLDNTHLHMCYIHYTTFVLTEISRQLLDVLPCIVRTFTCSDPRFSLIKVKCDGFRARN